MKIKYKDNYSIFDDTKEKNIRDLLDENMPFYGNDISDLRQKVDNINTFSIGLIELLYEKGVLSKEDIKSICKKIIVGMDEDSFEIVNE